MTRDDLSFLRNPFAADIHTVPMDFHEQSKSGAEKRLVG